MLWQKVLNCLRRTVRQKVRLQASDGRSVQERERKEGVPTSQEQQSKPGNRWGDSLGIGPLSQGTPGNNEKPAA